MLDRWARWVVACRGWQEKGHWRKDTHFGRLPGGHALAPEKKKYALKLFFLFFDFCQLCTQNALKSNARSSTARLAPQSQPSCSRVHNIIWRTASLCPLQLRPRSTVKTKQQFRLRPTLLLPAARAETPQAAQSALWLSVSCSQRKTETQISAGNKAPDQCPRID